MDEFLTWYRRLKVTGNYTAVSMYNQSKSVGKKPATSRRKGSSKSKPEIENYIDTAMGESGSSTPLVNSSTSASTPNPTGYRETPLLVNQSTCFPSLMSPMQQQAMQVPFVTQGTQISSPYAYQVNNSFHSSPYPSYVPSVNQPFEVIFLTGYIKICAGCHQGYKRLSDGKSLPPPNDLCLVHKEQHVYYNVVNNRQQLSSLSNVHYHMDVGCVKLRFPDFNSFTVQIPSDVKVRLQQSHRTAIFQAFGIAV